MHLRVYLMMLSTLSLTVACGGSTQGATDTADTRAEETADTSVEDTSVADTSVEDTSVGDTSVEDTRIADTSVEDTSVADTSVADTSVEDTSVADTSVEDTSVADTSVEDTSVADTSVADTSVADTSVEDTSVEDTNVADTNVADTWIEDTNVADTSVGDVAEGRCPGGHAQVIGPAGGVLAFEGFALRVPAGALVEEREICVTVAPGSADGYDLFTPVFRLEPAGLAFARPVEVELALTGDARFPAVFLSERAGPGFEWRGGQVGAGAVVARITHFSEVFGADGTDYDEPVDRSCTRTRVLEGRTGLPASVGLLVAVEDCHGHAISDLAARDFILREDGSPLSTEAEVGTLPTAGATHLVTLAVDLSASTRGSIDEVVAGLHRLVTRIAEGGVPHVRFALTIFAGEEHLSRWLEPTSDLEAVRTAIDLLPTWSAAEPNATNLFGAVVEALTLSELWKGNSHANSLGGSLEHGHLIILSDGHDTASWVDAEVARAAIEGARDDVVVVGLESADFDPATLAWLGRDGAFLAMDATGLETAFGAVGNRVVALGSRTYHLGYCSTKRAGSHEVSVHVVDSETVAGAHTFSAAGFGPGCGLEVFETTCATRSCGGVGCGACLDGSACDANSWRCMSPCTQTCTGGSATLPDGTGVSCVDECDRDAIPGDEDVCPFVTDPAQADLDGDGIGDLCDEDDDDDGVLDGADRCRLGATGWVSGAASDHDGDGCRDVTGGDEDADDDDDGILDGADRCPRGALGTSTVANDLDRDGCKDTEDDDDDGDGVVDASDRCPRGVIGPDLDGDGCVNLTEDSDSDGDGVMDGVDRCRLGASGWTSSGATDPDGDGCRGDEDTDDDDDGLLDLVDRCPAGLPGTSTLANDLDRDGCKDVEDDDDDDDGVVDTSDPCPRSAAGPDLDGDGCVDLTEDSDSDGDGVLDVVDRCPLGATGWVSSPATDHDRDGCRNNEDDDDDNDGVLDVDDWCPRGIVGWTPTPINDRNGDGCLDQAEVASDSDGDGIDDRFDQCPDSEPPFYNDEWGGRPYDVDRDGCLDWEDLDDDGDGVPDEVDLCHRALDPLFDDVSDRDGDGCQGWQDADRDDDGFANVRDACPDSVEVNWIPGPGNDANLDGCLDGGDATPPDADHDGVRDDLDWCKTGRTGWTSTAATDHDGDGCRDADEDWDDDNDQVADEVDACPEGISFDPWIADYGGDYDGDGCFDALEDEDDDGDGMPDAEDACPKSRRDREGLAMTMGCFGDEVGDRDLDGVIDPFDRCVSPLGWRSTPATDPDRDGCDNEVDLDDDGDGVADAFDLCPRVSSPRSSAMSDPDGDGCIEVDGGDRDGDGIPDAQDLCSQGFTEECPGWPSSGLCLDTWSVWTMSEALEDWALAADGGVCLVGAFGVEYRDASGQLSWRHAQATRVSRFALGAEGGRCMVVRLADEWAPPRIEVFGPSGIVSDEAFDIDGVADSVVGIQAFDVMNNMSAVGAIPIVLASESTRVGDDFAVRDYLVRFDMDGTTRWVVDLGEGRSSSMQAATVWGGEVYVRRPWGSSVDASPSEVELTKVSLAGEVQWSVDIDSAVLGRVDRVYSRDGVTVAVAGGVAWQIQADGSVDRRAAGLGTTRELPLGGLRVDSDTLVHRVVESPGNTRGDKERLALLYGGSSGPRGFVETAVGRRLVPSLRASRVVGDGLSVLASYEGNVSRHALGRYRPCAALSACTDDDACTLDGGSAGSCTHTRTISATCP